MASSPSPATDRRSAPELSDASHAPAPYARARGGQTVSGGEGRHRPWAALLGLALLALAWRWRRELRPVVLALALLAVPAIGHAASEGLAWVPLGVGLAAAGVVILVGHRPIHRWYAAGAGLAGLWVAAAWWAGLDDPVAMATFVLLLAGASWVWIRHVHPRSRVRVLGGSSWPWFGDRWERFRFQGEARRDIRRAMASWAVASYWGKVPRSSLRSAVADIDADHWRLTVELVAGHIGLDLDNRRAASAIGAPVAHVVVDHAPAGSDQPANVLEIRWFRYGVGESGGEEATDSASRPEPVDRVAERRERVVATVLEAGPLSGREVALRLRLNHDTVAKDLNDAEARGVVQRTAERKWVAA